MKRMFFIILIIFTNIHAIDMAISTVVYKGNNEDMAYMETYLSYEVFGLGIEENESSRFTTFTMNYQLLTPQGGIVDSFTADRTIMIPDNLKPPFDNMELIPANIKPGKYRVLLILTDKEGNQQKAEEEITVPNYWKDDGGLMSDIFLVGDIQEADSSQFDRYGQKFLPYPRSLYSPVYSMLQWIVELYKTEESDMLNIYISKPDGAKVKQFEQKEIPKSGIELSGFNITGFSQGEYVLHIEILDKGGKIKDTRTRYFSFTRDRGEPDVDEAQVELLETMLSYLVSPNELSKFKTLSSEGKLRFWNRIWEDKEEGAQDEFLQTWNYVAQTYETEPGARNGYKSDMGEIYLRFGPPNFVDRHALSGSSNPWVEWTYTEGRNVGYAIFGDVMNIGEMQLLSSDLPGYVEDENWRRKIARDHQEDPNSAW